MKQEKTSTEGVNLPLVSIIIPTYNHATYLPRAIDSCLRQTHRNVEVIVVDDGSTDGTRDILHPYKDQIVYIRQDNQGVSAARNAGLEQASGEFVAFLDADDCLTEDSIQVRLTVMLEHEDIGFVLGETYSKRVDEEELSYKQKIKRPLISKSFYEDLLLQRLTFGPNLIRSALAKRFRFPVHITNGEDIVYSTKLFYSGKGCYLPVPVAVITRRPGGQHRDINKIMEQGFDIIPVIFDDPCYGGTLEPLRRDFTSSRYLSLFRSLYLYGDARLAIRYYLLAISMKLGNVLKIRYFTKFVRACVRAVVSLWT